MIPLIIGLHFHVYQGHVLYGLYITYNSSSEEPPRNIYSLIGAHLPRGVAWLEGHPGGGVCCSNLLEIGSTVSVRPVRLTFDVSPETRVGAQAKRLII